MDLESAVRFLIGYEASLKLAPGQKPPPPSPFLFKQLSNAVTVITVEMTSKSPDTQFSGLPPSVWSDWPLCCGLDLTPKELQAARSLPPSLLRDRGLLSLFLALHSCAEAKVGRGASLYGPKLLAARPVLGLPQTSAVADPGTFPSAHLVARVGHRLTNVDDTLDLRVAVHSIDVQIHWTERMPMLLNMIARASPRLDRVFPPVPHEAAGRSLLKETAVMLEALCAALRRSEGEGPGVSNRIPIFVGFQLVGGLDSLLHRTEESKIGRSLVLDLYREAATLPGYNPVLLLHSLARSIDSTGRSSRNIMGLTNLMFEKCRPILWLPLAIGGIVSKLRPVDGYKAVRLGLEDLRQSPLRDRCSDNFLDFAVHALYSGLVQPEFILRARPQLLEGLVERMVQNLRRGPIAPKMMSLLVALSTGFPAVSFHLRRFFSRSGCLKAVQERSGSGDCGRKLIRLLGPRAAQVDTRPYPDMTLMLESIAVVRDAIRAAAELSPWYLVDVCDFIIRDLTLDTLREPRHAQPLLQYLSELTDEIAAPKRSDAPVGVLMVVGLGKACLALSNIAARALKDIREVVPQGSGPGRASIIRQHSWRIRLVEMARQLSLLRRRVLHELLPLAEAREAALWEGVREEEVAAALQEGA